MPKIGGVRMSTYIVRSALTGMVESTFIALLGIKDLGAPGCSESAKRLVERGAVLRVT